MAACSLVHSGIEAPNEKSSMLFLLSSYPLPYRTSLSAGTWFYTVL